GGGPDRGAPDGAAAARHAAGRLPRPGAGGVVPRALRLPAGVFAVAVAVGATDLPPRRPAAPADLARHCRAAGGSGVPRGAAVRLRAAASIADPGAGAARPAGVLRPAGPRRSFTVKRIHHKGTKDTKKDKDERKKRGGPPRGPLSSFFLSFLSSFVSFVPLW